MPASILYWQERVKRMEKDLGLLLSPEERRKIINRARAIAGGRAKADKMRTTDILKSVLSLLGDRDEYDEEIEKDEGTPAASLTPSDVHVDAVKQGKKKKKVTVMSNPNDYKKSSQILKSDDDKRLVTGIVLEPYTVDSQEDWETPEDIEKSAHLFMAAYRGMGIEHITKNENIYPVESWITPTAMIFDYGDEERIVNAGSWIMTAHVLDDNAWADVKKGDLTGFSVEGRGERDPVEISSWYLSGAVTKNDTPATEFAGTGNSFPIQYQADVQAAFHLLGRAGDQAEAVHSNIISIAQKKGFSLPSSIDDS